MEVRPLVSRLRGAERWVWRSVAKGDDIPCWTPPFGARSPLIIHVVQMSGNSS